MWTSKLIYKKMSKDEIIELSKKNDYYAIEELIKRIQPEVYALLSYLLKQDDVVGDLSQEILLKIAQNILSLKTVSCFNSWKNHIIMNTYYDYLRKHKNMPQMLSIECPKDNNESSIHIELTDTKNKPIEKCITKECENKIKSEIRNLPEPFKIAIILREFLGLSYDEIANITKSTIGTVKSRIARARLKLQKSLVNYI